MKSSVKPIASYLLILTLACSVALSYPESATEQQRGDDEQGGCRRSVKLNTAICQEGTPAEEAFLLDEK